MIHSSAQYAAALVQQLLAFSRGQEGQKAELSIRVMLREVVGFLSQTLPSTVKISLSLSEMPWLVYGDATQLKQVLVNLCMNARDAMPNGGAITITSSNTVLSAADAKILREIGPGKYVMIEVTDTGTGIPEEHFHKIFDPFFTTKDVGKGIGLGLAAVRGIVKGHHGSIIAESNYGFGATFRLYLPTSDLPTGPSRNGSETDTVRNGDGECILLVDDDASLREIMGTMLTSSGYRVLKAVSGNDALAIMKRHRDEIALVLTDITMSDMDGFTLIESLHSQKTYPPILAISGMTGCEHFDERAIELNVTLLAKPVSRETLLTSISAALAKGGGVSVAD
jgi:CheY-like chemotaxis protein